MGMKNPHPILRKLPEDTERGEELMRNLTPKQIVAELDQYIVGQADAKRAVAVAIRNRWRRQQLPAELRA